MMIQGKNQSISRSSLADSGKIQEIFLNHCRKNKISVILENHQEEIQGVIAGFDQETIVLDIGGQQMLFYKSAISSIKPQEEVNFIFNDAWRARQSGKDYLDFSRYS